MLVHMDVDVTDRSRQLVDRWSEPWRYGGCSGSACSEYRAIHRRSPDQAVNKVVVPRRVRTEEEQCTQRKNRMVTKHSG